MQLFHKNNGKKSLLIFFSGWALDFNSLAHLFSDELLCAKDLLFVWDYRTTDFNFDFTKYEKIEVVSFSYGVFMSQFVNLPKVDNHIAICGTFCPISKEFGINPKIFDLTLKTLSEETLQKFYRNMFEDDEQYIKFVELNKLSQISIENLRLELETIKELSQKDCDFSKITRAIISSNDKIIPTKAQQAFWIDKTKIKTINCGHFPFLKFSLEMFLDAK